MPFILITYVYIYRRTRSISSSCSIYTPFSFYWLHIFLASYFMDLLNPSSLRQNTCRPTNIGSSTNKINKICAAVKETFQIFTSTLLSLLLPLSFLLLARIATAHYLFSVANNLITPPPPTNSFLCSSLFLYSTKTPTILHLLVSLISIATVANISTIKITFPTQIPDPFIRRRCLYAAWILLAVVQVCVGVGIQGSIAAGIEGSGFGQEGNLVRRVMFFLGLHETTLFWWGTVVKPVVDDTIFGVPVADSWVEKVAMGVIYGGLWWGRIREEVEALAVVPELKKGLMIRIGVADFIGWWVYYLMVVIGIVRLIKGLTRTVRIVTRRRVEAKGRPLNDEEV